jgi:hypothetical protein
MKYLPASFFAILLAATAPLHLSAQEPASAFGLTPAKPDSLLPEGQGGLPLIPESIPPLDKPSTGTEKKEKKSATTIAEDALRDQVKLREAKTKAKSDPDMIALWDSTYKARTDYEQREIMTKYYTMLCDRIGKIDKTLSKDVIDSLRSGYLSKYDQDRIAPTLPPDGSTPVAAPVKSASTASPDKKKAKKKKN